MGVVPPGLYWAANVPQLVVTVAENCWEPEVATVLDVGVTETDTTFSGPTVTVAMALAEGSAMLVATTW